MELDKIIKGYEKYKTEDILLGTELPLELIDFKPSVDDLNAFCKKVPKLREKGYETSLAWYLTALIQKCDNKKITLKLPWILKIFTLKDLGYKLEDKEITVDGNLGSGAFMYARDCLVEIKGKVGLYFGHIAQRCSFKVKGKVGKNPLQNAYNCRLEII